ncbi:GNAT family N-acetyltransferase [Microbaculum marinisediminis]|uniref:GNAT family N-acetyltransferase n=1 Tax=Microbaculum marinisediminis TaxID=2931392 RepID=A0AAW5QXS9_9HYPH|nr:GNAT family N-acetyltransferase [Microbaculum sp. A6E488]MCT8971785.1 GNAT family N-acetyltransferase [Microbaculum sp. A6E488]
MAQTPTITLEDGPSKGRYVARIEGLPDAEMTFSRASPRLVIVDHTGVPDEMRGMGVGKALVARIVEDARERQFKIIPLCPFAKATIERTPEWHDVLN